MGKGWNGRKKAQKAQKARGELHQPQRELHQPQTWKVQFEGDAMAECGGLCAKIYDVRIKCAYRQIYARRYVF